MGEVKSQPIRGAESNGIQELIAGSKAQLVREMEMGVTVRKGEQPQLHKYIREDM